MKAPKILTVRVKIGSWMTKNGVCDDCVVSSRTNKKIVS
jgi:hypothetical protein